MLDVGCGGGLLSVPMKKLGANIVGIDPIKNNIEVAAKIGKEIASRALKKGIKEVVFDRGGFLYHGKIKALADAARENGLKL